MARIPDEELDRLKRGVDLLDLVRSSGVELKQKGGSYLGLCPFHNDKSPSLVVTPAKNLWSCLGACHAGGTVIDWVMRTEGVSFRHAVEILREREGMSPVEEGEPIGSQALACPLDLDADDEELKRQVVEYYHQVLKLSPEALGYLEQRGIRDEEAIETFKLGFANRTLGLRLPLKAVKAGEEVRGRLARLGIFRAGTGHEHLAGSLVIPVLDQHGDITELYGRKINRHLRKGTPLHLYLPGPHRGVWNLPSFRESRELILCESLIDALTFWVAGFRNVTSSFGTNGFTQDMVEAMKAYGTERVLVAYDRDDAGDKAAKKVGERLGGEGISSFRVLFPRGMDANDYARKVAPASQSLAVLLRSAEHLAGPVTARIPLNCPAEPRPEKPAISSAITEAEPLPPLAASSSPSRHVMTQEIPASPVPPAPTLAVEAEVSEAEVVIGLDGRRWRVRGLGRSTSLEQLKVNLLVANQGDDPRFHVDNFDLYSARHRAGFVKQASAELGVRPELLKKDLGRVLLKLEELQLEAVEKALEPEEKRPPMSEAERQEALALLADPQLLDRIVADFDRCGVVGEHTNKLVGYLAAVSRKLAEPLALLVQSSSAAGKSALMNAILAFVPPEERVAYSAMTGQSLFYMGEADLKHKVLAIAEEEGAEKASYALKLLQSEGELTIASTGKDPTTGRLVTHEYHVEGPVAIVLTTTSIDVDEELMSRCLVLSVDEEREQTRAIHRVQRQLRTLDGLRTRTERDAVLKLHQNAQRLLEPLAVVNPFAQRLTFLDTQTRTRRDHEKYLSLIDTIALLRQQQRKRQTITHNGRQVVYVEVTLDDIALANRLAAEVLGRTLDELPPQTRRFLELVWEMVSEHCKEVGVSQSEYRFSRREVLDWTSWSYDQLRTHMRRLVAYEYVLVHRGSRGHSFVYELVWDGRGREGGTFLMGLIDVDSLGSTTGALGGQDSGFGPPLAPHWAPDGPPLVADEKAAKEKQSSDLPRESGKTGKSTVPGTKKTGSSYSRERRTEPLVAAAREGR